MRISRKLISRVWCFRGWTPPLPPPLPRLPSLPSGREEGEIEEEEGGVKVMEGRGGEDWGEKMLEDR
jgi:hypothetical protein